MVSLSLVLDVAQQVAPKNQAEYRKLTCVSGMLMGRLWPTYQFPAPSFILVSPTRTHKSVRNVILAECLSHFDSRMSLAPQAETCNLSLSNSLSFSLSIKLNVPFIWASQGLSYNAPTCTTNQVVYQRYVVPQHRTRCRLH